MARPGRAQEVGRSGRFRRNDRRSAQDNRERGIARLRGLLADRFQLVVHKETKEQPIYALVLAKTGPKLQEAGTRAQARMNTTGPFARLCGSDGHVPAILSSIWRALWWIRPASRQNMISSSNGRRSPGRMLAHKDSGTALLRRRQTPVVPRFSPRCRNCEARLPRDRKRSCTSHCDRSCRKTFGKLEKCALIVAPEPCLGRASASRFRAPRDREIRRLTAPWRSDRDREAGGQELQRDHESRWAVYVS